MCVMGGDCTGVTATPSTNRIQYESDEKLNSQKNCGTSREGFKMPRPSAAAL